jgi:hypothetical protein
MFWYTHRTIIRLSNITWFRDLVLNNKGRERLLSVSQREVLRKIFGPAKDSEVWQIQYNRELYELFKEAEVI